MGYALGDANLIAALQTVKDSFNSYPLDALAQVAAVAAMEDSAYTEGNIDRIVKNRESARAELTEMGFYVLPSRANFLFCRHNRLSAEDLMLGLRRRGILVRRFSGERVRDFLRITVGDDAQMSALMSALRQLMA